MVKVVKARVRASPAEPEAAADKPHTCVPSCIAVGYLGPCGFLKVFARLVQSHTHTKKKES